MSAGSRNKSSQLETDSSVGGQARVYEVEQMITALYTDTTAPSKILNFIVDQGGATSLILPELVAKLFSLCSNLGAFTPKAAETTGHMLGLLLSRNILSLDLQLQCVNAVVKAFSMPERRMLAFGFGAWEQLCERCGSVVSALGPLRNLDRVGPDVLVPRKREWAMDMLMAMQKINLSEQGASAFLQAMHLQTSLLREVTGALVEKMSGSSNEVYVLSVDGDKVAIFKPVDGESDVRDGLGPLHHRFGADREEAVYLLDALAATPAGVPVTVVGYFPIDGLLRRGSIQKFVRDPWGTFEDRLMPAALADARATVPQQDAEALAVRDMISCQCDRHPGQGFFTGIAAPFGLAVFDNGLALPPFTCLHQLRFEAWISWPQLQVAPSMHARQLIKSELANIDATSCLLSNLRIDDECILSFRIAACLLEIGVLERKIPLSNLGTLMLRTAGDGQPSWLEQRVQEAVDGIAPLKDFPMFLQRLKASFRSHLFS
jgi:hypothetical protein